MPRDTDRQNNYMDAIWKIAEYTVGAVVLCAMAWAALMAVAVIKG
jgi:hypothetical protein